MTKASPSEPRVLPHKAPKEKYTVKINATPHMVIELELFNKLMYFINKCAPNECMWYSLIDRTSPLGDPKLIYRISDMFIPEQTLAPQDIETASSMSMMSMWQDLKAQRGLDPKGLGSLITRGKLWGHSHVKMAPVPSGDDDKQWENMKEASTLDTTKNPVAMIILNCHEEYTTRVYDPELKMEFTNVQLWIQDATDYSYVDDCLATKLQKPLPVIPKSIVLTTDGKPWASTPGTSAGNSYRAEAQALVEKNTPDYGKSTNPKSYDQEKAPITSTVRGCLTYKQLHSPSISNALELLEKLLIKLGFPLDTERSINALVDKLNTCQTKQKVEIRYSVEALDNLISGIFPQSGTKAFGLAADILDGFTAHIDESSSAIAAKMVKNFKIEPPRNWQGIANDFFERELVLCPQVFLFAIGVALLGVRTLKNEDPTQWLDTFDKYMLALVTVYKAVHNVDE